VKNYIPINKINESRISFRTTIQNIINSFSPLEKAVFGIFTLLLIISACILLIRVNNLLLIEVPAHGGSITEGIIGSPRFINPVLAISDSDRDLTALIYSGLMRASSDGTLIPDLAREYSISEDGKTYTFALKDNITFHDDTPVTADDIIFTVAMAQNSIVKSPRRANWDGVIVQKIDEKTIEFILPQPYAPFLENTTIGILPKHIWQDVPPEQFPFSQFNVEPIGSGPFLVTSIKRNSSGLPDSYKVSSFANFALGAPFLTSVTFRFYSNEEALIAGYNNGDVDAINSISPERAKALKLHSAHIETKPLPRIFGVFFNQNQADIFVDEKVREALAIAVPKEKIIDDVLGGYAVVINSPIPPGILKNPTPVELKDAETRNADALQILESDGWKKDEETGVLTKETKKDGIKRLSFSISTSNTIELKSVASIVADAWRSLGAEIDLRFFEISDLNQNVIRSRDYDALLFGEIVGRELDLFSFWHSSQRNDPGLNIALYANIAVDKILEQARAHINQEERYELFEKFEQDVQAEYPAVFLYAPLFIYIVPDKIHDLSLGSITTSSERFANIYSWYIETEYVWPFFTH